MTETLLEKPWPLSRWLLCFAIVLALQLAGIFWGSAPLPSPRATQAPVGGLVMLPHESEPAFWKETLAQLPDPTLFALPHPNGFSGRAWLAFHPTVPVFANWTEPPQWLPLAQEELSVTFSQFVQTNHADAAAPPERSAARTAGLDIYVPPEVTRTQTVVRWEGGLKDRPLVAPLVLPDVINPDLVPPTVLQLGVDGAGRTHSAIVLESGLKPYDAVALAAAARARFAESATNAPGILTFGRMVVHWNVVPPGGTNAGAEPVVTGAEK